MAILQRFFNTRKALKDDKKKFPFYQGTHFQYTPKTVFRPQGNLAGIRHVTHVSATNPLGMIKVKPRPEYKQDYPVGGLPNQSSPRSNPYIKKDKSGTLYTDENDLINQFGNSKK